MAKLKHGDGDDWNQHRNDVANLTAYVESRWQLDLTWQVIDLSPCHGRRPAAVPVVYLCGSKSPLPERSREQQRAGPEAARLRRPRRLPLRRRLLRRRRLRPRLPRTDGGGVPNEPEYRLHLLRPEHPIWHAEENVARRQQRPLLGIEFGCRTSVVYAPPDPPLDPRPSLSCLWELSRSGRQQHFTAGGRRPDRRRPRHRHQRAGLRHQSRVEEEVRCPRRTAPPPDPPNTSTGAGSTSPSSAIRAAATRRRGP